MVSIFAPLFCPNLHEIEMIAYTYACFRQHGIDEHWRAKPRVVVNHGLEEDIFVKYGKGRILVKNVSS